MVTHEEVRKQSKVEKKRKETSLQQNQIQQQILIYYIDCVDHTSIKMNKF